MVNLTDLPIENLAGIASQVSPCSLSALALTCRTLYQVASSQLYRYIYFTETDYTDEEYKKYGSQRTYGWLESRQQSAQIFNLNQFWRTVITCPRLREKVRGASFRWRNESDTNFEDILGNLIDMLTPSLKILSLAPAHFDLKLPCAKPVTSLEIWYPHIGFWHGGQVYAEEIHALFAIPTLRHLSLMKARDWNCFPDPAQSSRRGTSNIESLYLPNTVPGGKDLDEILTWPKALKAFHMEIIPDRSQRVFYANSSPSWFSPKDTLVTLRSQRKTLEEVIFSNRGIIIFPSDGTTFDNFRDFKALKRLAAPRGHLALSQKEVQMYGKVGESFPRLYEQIPPNLEELCVEVERAFQWTDTPTNRHGDSIYGSEAHGWILEVAAHKKERFPSLRRVKIWKPGVDACPQPCCHSEIGEDILGVFQNANIELVYNVSMNFRPFSD